MHLQSTTLANHRFIENEIALDLDSLTTYTVAQEDIVAQSIIEEEIAGSKDFVSIQEIIQISGRLNESIIDIFKRLQKFVPLGLKLRQVDPSLINKITVTREDLIAFSERFRSFYDYKGSSWVNNQVTPAKLIKAAVNLNEPVRDTLARFQRFIPLGLQIPEFDLEPLEELVKSEEDLIALSKTLTKELRSPKDILQGEVHPTRIILAALALKEPVSRTLERFRRFAPVLGLVLPKGEPDTWRFCADED